MPSDLGHEPAGPNLGAIDGWSSVAPPGLGEQLRIGFRPALAKPLSPTPNLSRGVNANGLPPANPLTTPGIVEVVDQSPLGDAV